MLNDERGKLVVASYTTVCVTLILYGSPFEKVRQVLKYKSAVFIPIHMVCAGSTNNAFWIVYTYLDKDWFLFVTNVCCFVLGVGQLTLYCIYHPSRCPLPESYGKDDGELHASVSVAAASPHLVHGAGRGGDHSTVARAAPPPSPAYELVHSPLVPVHHQQQHSQPHQRV